MLFAPAAPTILKHVLRNTRRLKDMTTFSSLLRIHVDRIINNKINTLSARRWHLEFSTGKEEKHADAVDPSLEQVVL